jgi:hypothetical protein
LEFPQNARFHGDTLLDPENRPAREARESYCARAKPKRGFGTCRRLPEVFVRRIGAGRSFDVFKPRGDPGRLIDQWRHIKRSASDALIAAGGTITHHHAVGRDHMPWYRAQRPDLFGRAFAAAKRGLDPAGVMNPGVLAPSRAFLRRPEVVARAFFCAGRAASRGR